MVLAGVVVAGIAGWVARPFVDMARRGTIDERTVAAWRAEPAHAPAVEVPAPRSATDEARISA